MNKKIKFLIIRIFFVTQRGNTQRIIATGGRPIIVYETTGFSDEGTQLAFRTFIFFIQKLKGNNRQACFFQQLRFGVYGQKFVGRQVKPIFKPNNIIGRQDDINITATLGETFNPGVAFKLKLTFGPESNRLDIGHTIGIIHFNFLS